MRKVVVILAEGFEEIEAVTVIDILRRAGVTVTICHLGDTLYVSGSHLLSIEADKAFFDIDFDNQDMIILPGGMPGAMNLNNHEGLKTVLGKFNQRQKYLGAICAAPLVLGVNGILKGRKATCYPGFEKYLEGAEILTDGVVLDGHVLTGKGVAYAIAFSLKAVEMLVGKKIAENVASKILYN